jgi:hypothetical protein
MWRSCADDRTALSLAGDEEWSLPHARRKGWPKANSRAQWQGSDRGAKEVARATAGDAQNN